MKRLERRVPPPVAMVIVAASMWLTARFSPNIAIDDRTRLGLAGGFALAAAVFAAPGIMAFRRAGTTPDPVHVDRASTLVTTGVYAWTRNPMYVGLTLLLCAWACVLAAPWTAAGPPLFAAYITRFQILPEERALSERFGEAYAAYLRRVRRWI